MKIEDVIQSENINFEGIESSYFLIGLLSAFDNRFQAVADKTMGEISWKQFFAFFCINLCREDPTIRELSEIMGSSHLNVKQLLLKLEKKGFVHFYPDANDRRKQRIQLTEYCMDFCTKNNEVSSNIMKCMFDGISEEQLNVTIQTIMQIENNLEHI